MRASSNNNGASTPRGLLRSNEQRFVAAVLLVTLIGFSVHWALRGLRRNDLIEIEKAAPRSTDFQVAINEAGWPEIAQLPGIGETLARSIVAERQARGAYRDLADLAQRVDGIGPVMLANIEPFVSMQVAASTAAEGDGP